MNDKVEMSTIKQAIENLTKRVNEQVHNVSDKIKKSTKDGQEKIGQLRSVIEERPLQAIGVAVAVGWIVGHLFKRNRKD